jgi:hypothetical protein
VQQHGVMGAWRSARLALRSALRPSQTVHQLEIEGEADVWGPHVSEWREREAVGVFWSIRKMRTCIWSDSGPRHSEDVENDKDHVEEELWPCSAGLKFGSFWLE